MRSIQTDKKLKQMCSEYADWCHIISKSGNHTNWEKFVDDSLARNWTVLTLKSDDNDDTISMRPNGLYLNDLTGTDDDGQYSIYHVMENYPIIHSVQYMDEVFTIGDTVTLENSQYVVKKFREYSDRNKIEVIIHDGGNGHDFTVHTELSRIRKVAPVQTYVTTGDNSEVLPGDKYYGVSVQASGVSDQIKEYVFRPNSKTPGTNRITFKNREQAVCHLLDNIQVLSKNECMALIGVGGEIDVISQRLNSYVLSKVQLPDVTGIKA